MITHFEVRNYKCLEQVAIALTPVHALVGQNDTGKSSFLEAVYAFCKSADHPLRECFEGLWTGQELVYDGREPAVVTLTATLCLPTPAGDQFESVQRTLEIKFLAGGRDPRRQGECFKTGDQPVEVHGGGDRFSGLVREAAASSKGSGPEFLSRVRNAISGVHKYHFDPHQLSLPSALTTARRFRMEFDGFGLPSLLNDILLTSPESFIRLREEFCALFPGFKSLSLRIERGFVRVPTGDGADLVRTDAGHDLLFHTTSGREVRAAAASDGVLLMLALLSLKYLPEPPRTVLLEEPENGLHPQRLRDLVGFLREMAWSPDKPGGPQFVLSSHSPYLLDELRPEEVTAFVRDPGQPARAYSLKDSPTLKERLHDFLLGEVIFNEGERALVGGE